MKKKKIQIQAMKYQKVVALSQESENIKLAELIREYDDRFGHILGYRRMTLWINHFNSTHYKVKRVHRIMNHPRKLYLVLQCYANLDPAVLDAAWISCRGNYPSKAGKFIGSMFFGFDAAKGYSITNLGSVESGSMTEAFFIPPASPAIRKTQGILTVNGIMTACTSER